jgi:hypothetical protein
VRNLPHFHPQRLHPAYARLAQFAAQSPTRFIRFHRRFPRAWDRTPSYSEDFDLRNAAKYAVAVIGFPRTGTTYLQYAMQEWLIREDQVFKNHDVLVIPAFLDVNIEVFVTLRDPIKTCASWSFYNNDPLLKSRARHRLRTYIAWHQLLMNLIPEPGLHLLEFNEFTESLQPVTSALSQVTAVNSHAAAVTVQQVRTDLYRSQVAEGAPLHTRNTPSRHRSLEAAPYYQLYESLTRTPVARKATRIFQQLTQHE